MVINNLKLHAGDSAYPLQRWLMTPVRSPQTQQEENYNDAHSRTRVAIEQCFGILKMRFRCLQRYRTLHFAPDRCCRIVNACAVLHNMCIAYSVHQPEDDDVVEGPDAGVADDQDMEETEEAEDASTGTRNRALQMRTQLITRAFNRRQRT